MVICLISLICGCSINKSNTENSLTKTNESKANILVDENLIYENLNTISTNIRNYGSDGSLKTINYIKNKLMEYGYSIDIQKFNVYEQDLSTLNPESNWDYLDLNLLNSEVLGVGNNIVAKSFNYNKNKKDIYITAHYDSTTFTSGVIDNATGTSINIEIARILKNFEGDFNINFIFFDAEEYYRYGSKYFVSTLSQDEIKKAIGAINLDMIGEKNAGDLIIQVPSINENIISILFNDKLEKKLKVTTSGSSDDLSFYMGKIPAITLTDENSNFNLDKENKEIQLQNIDVSILKNTINLVSKFITNLSIDEYDDILKNKTNLNLKDDISNISAKIKNINEFELIDIEVKLIENGYTKEINYIYKNNKDKYFFIKEINGKFMPKNYKTEFVRSINDPNWYYKKIDNKIFFKGLITSGEIGGDISPDEAMNILQEYYSYEHNKLFGEYPEKKLF